MALLDDTVGFPGLPWVAAAMVGMALATCWVPTARGLRVRPSEALRAEG